MAFNPRHNLRLVFRGGGLHPDKSQPEISQSVRAGGGGARGLMRVAQRLRRAAWTAGYALDSAEGRRRTIIAGFASSGAHQLETIAQ